MAENLGAFDCDPDEHDVEFLRSEATKMYGGINPERWERIHEQDFLPIAEEITGQRCLKHSFIRCPFHGRDSTPSFKIYNNDAYCFGCSTYYDAITLVAKHQGVNHFKALLWLENYYKLPPLEPVPYEPADEVEEGLKFPEVKARYIAFAAADLRKQNIPELAEDYLRYYFEGKAEDDVMPLLGVLGPVIVAEIVKDLE